MKNKIGENLENIQEKWKIETRKLIDIVSKKTWKVLSWVALIWLLSSWKADAKFLDFFKTKNKPKPNITKVEEDEIRFWISKIYNLSNLANYDIRLKCESLYMRYLYWDQICNLPKAAKIPDSLVINFKKNLDDLWQSKLRRYWKKNPVLEKFYHEKVEPITTWKKKPTKSSLEKYRKEMKIAISNVNENINLDVVLENYWKKTNHKLFKGVVNMIKDKDLLAYNLTELFDSSNWKFNLEFFDFLLKNAWREYVSLIPALWDKYLSYWPFQNTKYVVSPTGNSVKLDKLGKKRLISDNMYNLRFTNHHEVAYYNAIYNLLCVFNKLNNKQEKTLTLLLKNNKDKTLDNIMQFVAAAHNNPRAGQKWFISWINNEWKYDVYYYVKPKFSWYAKRSKYNRVAIKK